MLCDLVVSEKNRMPERARINGIFSAMTTSDVSKVPSEWRDMCNNIASRSPKALSVISSLRNELNKYNNLSKDTLKKIETFLDIGLSLNLRFGADYKEIYLLPFGRDITDLSLCFSYQVMLREVYKVYKKHLDVHMYHIREIEAYNSSLHITNREGFKLPEEVPFGMVYQDFKSLDDLAGYRVITRNSDWDIKGIVCQHIRTLFTSGMMQFLYKKIKSAGKSVFWDMWFVEMLKKYIVKQYIKKHFDYGDSSLSEMIRLDDENEYVNKSIGS